MAEENVTPKKSSDSAQPAPTATGTTATLPSTNAWQWGFTNSAEVWNGRLAMLGFIAAVIVELISGKGILTFYGLI